MIFWRLIRARCALGSLNHSPLVQRKRISSCSRISDFRSVQNILPEVGAETLRCSQIDFAPREQFRQFDFHAGDAQQSGNAVWFEFDEQVDIDVRAEVIPQRRAEDSEPLDSALLAEGGQRGLRYNASGFIAFAPSFQHRHLRKWPWFPQ